MSTLTVGANGTFTTLASAIAASHDGDVIQVQAGTYTNDFSAINDKITIEGVGGLAHLVATASPPDGKAILTISNDVSIDHLEFSGAVVADNNGAGIRYQGGNLTITNSFFHDNQDGILGGPATAATGTISISTSEFANNGAGDGSSHNLYIGDVAQLTLNNDYFTAANVGHEIKSRAESTTVTNSRIQDGPSGTASYSIDLPNGGRALIQNDVIEQGPNSQNPGIIAYGEEGGAHANSTLTVTGDTILNDLKSPSASAVWNASSAPASLTNSSIYGLSPAQFVLGAVSTSGLTTLSSEPALDTSSPIQASSTPVSPPPTGTDTIVVDLSEDAWQGDALFNLTVDGALVSAGQSVTASHAQGKTEAFAITGNFGNGTGTHDVGVTFTNDAYGGTPQTDRNLYVDGVTYDGTAAPSSTASLFSNGTVHIAVSKTSGTSTPPVTAPPSSGGIVIHASEDAWQGDAQFTVSVDEVQQSGTFTATASHALGQSQTFALAGSFSAGPHDVGVTFLNDAWGGTPQTDRNLYVDSIDDAGVSNPSAHGALLSNGTSHFAVTTTPAAPDTLIVNLSEDAYQGDAEFIVALDGKSLGPVQTVTALHGAGQSQAFTYTGQFGSGTHDLSVQFVNDAYAGTPQTDRNLYVNSASFDGSNLTGASASLFSNSTWHDAIPAH